MSKLIVTLNNINNLEGILKFSNVETVVVSNEKFSNRVTKSFDIEEISKCTKICHEQNKKIYISISKIFHENEIKNLEEYIGEVINCNIDGIIFSDFAVYEIVRKINSNIKLSYSTDTTITNSYFTSLAFENNIESVFLAKEISLKEIKEINKKKQTPIVMFIHGHIYMYNSYRKLVSEYLKEVDENIKSNKYFLYDDERKAKYPIVENDNGVNILASQDLMSINFLYDIIDSQIDYLYIDSFLYENDDYIYILKKYDEMLNFYKHIKGNPDAKIQFKNRAQEVDNDIRKAIKDKQFSSGFLLKETIF